MNINFSIEFDPSPAILGEKLEADIGKIQSEYLGDFVKLAPGKLQAKLGAPPPSQRGGHPARRTGTLLGSQQGRMVGKNAGELSMVHYAGFLDPFLGGNLNRPFIEDALDETFDELGDEF